jgi:hypothetical protein
VLALLALLTTVAGCADAAERDPFPIGRACQAIEFDTVEAALGVRFETSSAARVDQTWSCVLGLPDRSFPDLTVTLSETSANEVIIRASSWPSGATTVDGLGRIAYQLALPPSIGQDGAPSGPGLRIGWLSAAPQLMMLRFTWPADATAEQIAALTPALLDLARGIEQQIVTVVGGVPSA